MKLYLVNKMVYCYFFNNITFQWSSGIGGMIHAESTYHDLSWNMYIIPKSDIGTDLKKENIEENVLFINMAGQRADNNHTVLRF